MPTLKKKIPINILTGKRRYCIHEKGIGEQKETHSENSESSQKYRNKNKNFKLGTSGEEVSYKLFQWIKRCLGGCMEQRRGKDEKRRLH